MQATISQIKLTQKTQKTINEFGLKTCLLAYQMNEIEGEGPTVVSSIQGLGTIGRADRAINAGREYVKKNKATKLN